MKVAARLLGFLLFVTVAGAHADSLTFTVSNTNNAGAGSLRQAILDANGASASCEKQTIAFNIPGAGVHTIQPTSPLPDIQIYTLIDGYTQPGSALNSANEGDNAVILIELDGSNAGASNGFRIGGIKSGVPCTGNQTTIAGLAINHFSLAGIEASGPACTPPNCFAVGALRIYGTFIGTDPTGKIARGNGTGIHFGFNSSNNIVGDELLVDGGCNSTPCVQLRNIISGNASDGVLLDSTNIAYPSQAHHFRGNYIGVDATGTQPLPNGRYGFFADAGSTAVALHNSIVGAHSTDGVRIVGGQGSSVLYNAIGVGIGGVALPNAGDGIHIMGDATGIGVGNTYPAISGAGFASVAHNGGAGLYIEGNNSVVDVVGGAFGSNGGLGIDLAPRGVNPNNAANPGVGPNRALNAPVLLTAKRDNSKSPPTTVTGEVDTTPNVTAYVYLYLSKTCDPSGFGEGEGESTFASVNTDGAGHGTFTLASYAPSGTAVTTFNRQFVDVNGVPELTVSEFSNCIIVGDDVFADGFGG
jgi:hypothetical protein